MIGHLRYLWSVLRHKWFVLVECLKLGLPLYVGLTHDLSKFRPDEFLGYSRGFYTLWGRKQYNPYPMTDAWMRHQWRNPHHWQYWVMIDDRPLEYQAMMIWDKGDISLFASFGTDQSTLARMDLDPTSVDIMSIPMPERYWKEMIADWRGAGRAYGNPDTRSWYLERHEMFKRFLHPETRFYVEMELSVL